MIANAPGKSPGSNPRCRMPYSIPNIFSTAESAMVRIANAMIAAIRKAQSIRRAYSSRIIPVTCLPVYPCVRYSAISFFLPFTSFSTTIMVLINAITSKNTAIRFPTNCTIPAICSMLFSSSSITGLRYKSEYFSFIASISL